MFGSTRTVPRAIVSFAIVSLTCLAASTTHAREPLQPPCVVDTACVRVPLGSPHPEAALGRLPGYADPPQRDGASSPIATVDAAAWNQATGAAQTYEKPFAPDSPSVQQ